MEFREELIKIIGFGIERERAECKADEILSLFADIQNPCSQCSYKEELKAAEEHINELYGQIKDMEREISFLESGYNQGHHSLV